jgi:peptidoglycan/LPS O-acetylase OafA/YrhL
VGRHRAFPTRDLRPTEALTPWIRPGFLGVEVFFILSGFIISYQWADRFSMFNMATFKAFVWKRFARIYPMHFVTLLGLGVIVLVAMSVGIHLSGRSNYTLGSFAGNLVNLQALPGIPSFNNPSWSISVEFAAYLFFPIIALGLARIGSARSGFGIAGVVVTVGVVAMMAVASTINDSPTGEAMIWLRIATEFSAGCLLFAGWRHLENKRFGVHWDWVSVLAMLALVGVLGITGGEGSIALITVPIIAIFVLGCAGSTGFMLKMLSSRLMMWGGRVSYSVYMTHFVVLMVLGELLSPDRFAGSPLIVRLAVVSVYLLTAVGVGAIGYHFVEEPARVWLTRLSTRKNQQRGSYLVRR